MSDIYRRSLVFIVWQKASGFEKNIGKCLNIYLLRQEVLSPEIIFILILTAIGAVEIYFGKFNFDQNYSAWYPLFPIFSMGLVRQNSPWLIKNVSKQKYIILLIMLFD